MQRRYRITSKIQRPDGIVIDTQETDDPFNAQEIFRCERVGASSVDIEDGNRLIGFYDESGMQYYPDFQEVPDVKKKLASEARKPIGWRNAHNWYEYESQEEPTCSEDSFGFGNVGGLDF